MPKVLTFSRTFPSYHPKAGQLTGFVEKFWNAINFHPLGSVVDYHALRVLNKGMTGVAQELYGTMKFQKDRSVKNKVHTIRAGYRFNEGDFFSPRVWRGKPYHSKQIVIAPDQLVVRVYDFEMFQYEGEPYFSIDGEDYKCRYVQGFNCESVTLLSLCYNDGLRIDDFLSWFKYPKPFQGQIIVWDKDINY